MIFVATFLVLSAMGMFNAGYLVYEHWQNNATLVCPMDHDCTVVTESKWSRIFGVRNDTLVLLFFIAVFLAALYPLGFHINPGLVRQMLIFATGGSLGFSLFLVALQIWVIKDYCFYCLISAGITALLFINSFLLNYHGRN